MEEDINADYEYEMKNKMTDEELMIKIKTLLGIKNINEIFQYNTKIRDGIIKKIGKIKGTSCSQISRVLGLKRGVIERAIKNNKRKEEEDVSQIAQK